jgi:hypothetical protein
MARTLFNESYGSAVLKAEVIYRVGSESGSRQADKD